MMENDLPIKVGQMSEVMSFLHGYRGAWFRCKIQKIARRNGEPHIGAEYPDYPEEKILWTKVYQWAPSVGGVKRNKRKQMMVRPCFPPVYRKSEKPDVDNNLELAVIAEDDWKVGDLVDWWTTGCYWSARVTKILDDGKLEIELPPPPEGEGSTYEVCSKDLRPSLNWSPESGWTLPNLMDGENSRHQLIKPANEGKPVKFSVAGEAPKNISADRSSNASFSSQTQPRGSSPREQIAETAEERPLSTSGIKSTLERSDAEVQKPCSSDTVLNFDAQKDNERDAEPCDAEVQQTCSSDTVLIFDAQKDHERDAEPSDGEVRPSDTVLISDAQKDNERDAAASLERLKSEGTIRLNSTFSESLEDAVLDLERLASHVRMLQDMLKVGMLSKTGRFAKIPQRHAPSIPKCADKKKMMT